MFNIVTQLLIFHPVIFYYYLSFFLLLLLLFVDLLATTGTSVTSILT